MGPVAPFIAPIATLAGGLLGSRKGPTQQTVTQEASVPQQLLPGFNDALRSILGQFGQSGSASGFENINQPLGRNLIGRTLSGQFLDPFQNPGLQGVLDRGGDFIKQRLNTDFARSGRDLGAGRPAAADALGSFTSNLLFNNFNAERARQQGALGQVGSFDPTNNFLDRFGVLSNVASGNQSTTVPLSQDRLSGALGGIQAGGAVGDILSGIFKGRGGGDSGFNVKDIF
jgi:hypothetical protein